MLPGAGGFHGAVNVNFKWDFFTDYMSANPAGTIGSNQIDLYSRVLHEAMHALGFNSMLEYKSGHYQSVINHVSPGYFSRYDTHLQSLSGTKAISKDACYASSFNTAGQ